MLLLSDGTVICADNSGAYAGSTGWFRLTPDLNGSYINGTWTTLAPMHYPRSGFAADVVPDGRVFVAGGEYGTGITHAEIYDPLANSWTVIDPPTSLFDPSADVFSDMISAVIANGRVLMAPLTPLNCGGTLIYDVKANAWSNGPVLANGACNQGECSWAKLADGSILTIDECRQTSQRYIPSLNQWVSDSPVPVSVWNTAGGGCEIGPAVTLPNGTALFMGGNGVNVIYTPSGNANPGAWAVAAASPNNLEIADAPGAMMVNGKILCVLAANCGNGGCPAPYYLYEYDYSVGAGGSFTPVLTNNSAYVAVALLDLPDGTVLASAYTNLLHVYQPDGSPLAAGKPAITSITANADGSFHLAGTGLNGISEGATFGDDAQMDSNYPLVRVTDNASGNIYYARTFNWSGTGIQTGSATVTTEFTLPAGLCTPGGMNVGGNRSLSLVVVANGIASDSFPMTFQCGAPNNSCACTGSNGVMAAETFTTLHSFTNGSDGSYPYAGLVLSGNTLYGAAYAGGLGDGTVFSLETNGTGFTNLHNFSYVSGNPATNRDGVFPLAELLLSGNTLYGTAQEAGSGGYGTVFSLDTNGAGFTTLYNFTNGGDGQYPYAGLVLSGGRLYGTTVENYVGGASRLGTIFAVNTNGTGFTTLHNFTNGGGAYPYAHLILSGNTLYGTASEGGISNNGTVFALNTDGTGFTILHSFTNGSDGADPEGGLILSGSTLYGTTLGGGGSGEPGTVFALDTNGAGFRILHSFSQVVYDRAATTLTNSDGTQPEGALILSGDTLYGTATAGGSSGDGTVFALNTNGTVFTTLHSFTAGVANGAGTNSDGAVPIGGLIIWGNTLYGTAYEGGSAGYGTVFALTLTNSATSSNCLQVQSPGNIVATSCTNVQEFYAPTVTDLSCSNWTVVLTPPSGSSFAPGTVTTVNCSVTDCCGNSNNSSFTVTVACAGSPSTNNIIQNGNFCLGNTNFGSDYQYVAYNYTNYTQTPQVAPGDYTIGTNVPPSYFDWTPFDSVNGGCAQMLIVNGATNASESVWDQVVTVLPDTTYTISFYLAEISNPALVAEIAVVLGGNQIGTATAPSVIDTWQQYSFTWNSGTNITVLLALKDLQTSDPYNDFAIDNISMSAAPPQLSVHRSGANFVVLTWPANTAGFTLQSTTNLAPPAVWTTVSPPPAIVNGQFAVTNSISVTDMFYRLSQ